MALLMVHLLAARRFAQRQTQYLEDADYYLGAISPDAIHVRDHDDKSHKNEIHLNNWQSPHPEDVLAYWRAHRSAFDIGYGVHVLTDGQWVQTYRRLFPQILRPDGKVDVPRYYADTFATDFELYRMPVCRHMIDLFEQGTAPADHPLLTFEEIDTWKRMMVDSYRGDDKRREPAVYLNRAFVDVFIEDCQALIDETYARIGEE